MQVLFKFLRGFEEKFGFSEAVLGVISLISPLEFSGDYRPYFTIYDPDYRLYQEEHEKKKIGNVILGVTNPLFLKVIIFFEISLIFMNRR